MDADELKKFVTIILSDNPDEVVLDFGRIGTGCAESRYLRFTNPSSDSLAFQLRRDPLSHPLGDVFKVCPTHGEIARGGTFKVAVKYRPRFPHVKDIDYFSVPFGGASSLRLRLEGVSTAPGLSMSRDSLEFEPLPASRELRRSFELVNDGAAPAAFSFPFRSSLFDVEPCGGEVAPGQRRRVVVSCWAERPRPARRQLPLLVHNGASQQLQLLAAGAGRCGSPPAAPPAAPVVLDVDRLDFGRTSAVDGGVRVLHVTNTGWRDLRVQWLADRRRVFSVQPADACLRSQKTAMFEVLFLPDLPDQLYFGQAEALLWPLAADAAAEAESSVVCPTLGQTFAEGAESWVPRVQLTPSPLVMPPCPLTGSAVATCTLRNLDPAKPVVYDLREAEGLLVRPAVGCVPAGGLQVFTVEYTASGPERPRIQLRLRWRLNLHDGHSLELAVLVSQEAPAAAWTPAALSLPPACPGMMVRQAALVRNLTRCRLLLAAEPSDAVLDTDTREATLAPNQTRRVVWSCRPEQCGLHEFVVPHRLRLVDPCDRPLPGERVHGLRLTVRVVAEAVSADRRLLELGDRPLGAAACGHLALSNDCASAVSLLLALLPRPLETEPSGEAGIVVGDAAGPPPPGSAVRRLTVAAGESAPLTLSARPDRPGSYRYDLTYRLLADDGSERAITPPRALAELSLRAHHPHLRVADLEAVCGERFEDKALLWRLLAVDRLNAALADAARPAEPVGLVFPPRPAGAPPLRLVLLLENPGRVPVAWRWEGLDDAVWLSLAPAAGQLAPREGAEAERQTLRLTVGPLADAGLRCARLQLAVDGGCRLPVTAVATAVAAGRGWVFTVSEPSSPGLLLPSAPPERPSPLQSALGRDGPLRLPLHPVPVGCRAPPLQFCPLFNGGLQPVAFHVHTDGLGQLADENYGVEVLRCLDTEGTVPAGGCVRLRIVFEPLEQREYSALMPVCVSERCCFQPLLVVGRGTAPAGSREQHEDATDPASPGLPDRQQATMPDQQVLLSHRYIHFGTLSIHMERSRIIYLQNVSGDVLRFAWTRRLAAGDCCAIYGAADSAPGGGDQLGPIVRPEPAEGVLNPGEVLPVRLTLAAGQLAQVYAHTVHLAFRNLTRERLYTLNHAAWETESRRRQEEFIITEARPDGEHRPPEPPPPEPAVVYMTVSLAALVRHVDDTPLGSDVAWRERVFVPLMTAAAGRPAAAPPAADELACVRRLLSVLLWSLLHDCELQSALKRLRKDAVPTFAQLDPRPAGRARRFLRPRLGEQPLLLERALSSTLFNLVREAVRGEFALGDGVVTGLPLPVRKPQPMDGGQAERKQV